MPRDLEKQSARGGRDFELLVKRIKEHQSPDARISSPEFVDDVDTGQPREVDIGVRVPRNGDERFIAIECRDRTAQQSVEWIEQLISKKESIGADALIAITSSRFSKPARIKALKHGIILAEMSQRLPEELSELAKSFFIKLEYLAPEILSIDLQLPSFLIEDLDAYRYIHKSFPRDLSLQELAQVWTTPSLVRAIPKFVEDWHKSKFCRVELAEIDAMVIATGITYPIQGAKLTYKLAHGELALPLRAVQELSMLDGKSDIDAKAFAFGAGTGTHSEVIVDLPTGNLRWDVLGKALLDEGKVLIGVSLWADGPVSITTMRLDL